MKKTLLSAAMIAGLGMAAFAPLSAQAASSGTINFTGRVLADTCTITVNNLSTSLVTLPQVSATVFGSTVGTVAGATSFPIALTGCDTNTKNAQIAFTGGNIDNSTGDLANATSGGSNVEIRLLNSSSQVINTSTQANAPAIAVASGTGSTTLTAEYVSTNAATSAGLVTSSVGFTLTYQ